MSTNGFDDLAKELDNLAEKAKELEGTRNVKLVELLNNDFMSSHTQFNSIDDFSEASNFDWEKFEEIPENELDLFVSKNSSFNSWDEMLSEAATSYYAKQLGF